MKNYYYYVANFKDGLINGVCKTESAYFPLSGIVSDVCSRTNQDKVMITFWSKISSIEYDNMIRMKKVTLFE